MKISNYIILSFLTMMLTCAEAALDESEDDGLFCNGAPGEPPIVCYDGIACTVDVCSNERRECVHVAPDKDQDGHGDFRCYSKLGEPLGDDCDDNDVNRFPGNIEVCDAQDHDEDCNVETFGNKDEDGDGFISTECGNWDTPVRVSPKPAYFIPNATQSMQ